MLNTNKAQFENSVTLLKDDAGKLIKDADGNVLGEIEVMLEDGSKEKAQILLNEDEAKLKNAADEVEDGNNGWIVDISKVKKIGDRYPINAQDYTSKKFSFDISANEPKLKKILGTAEEQAERQKFELLKQKYPNGVNFDEFGFPRFEPYAVKVNGKVAIVPVKTIGNASDDFIKADALLNIDKEYRQLNNLTWHHVEDTETMILVPSDLHKAVRHTGGISVSKNFITEE